MHATDPREHNDTEIVNHFKNQVQRFINAYDDVNKGTFNTM